MRLSNWQGIIKILILFLIPLLFILSGCQKSLTVTFPPAGEQNVTGTDLESMNSPNRIKAAECYDQGNYIDALEYLQVALKEEVQKYGKEHPSVATILNEIGESYLELGDLENALDYFQQAIAIDLATLGEHSNTAVTYANIGRVYSASENYDLALKNLEKALAIDLKLLGEESRQTAITYGDIATVYDNMGYFDAALEYFNKELEIERKVCGENSEEVGTTYNNIGLLHSHYEKHTEALDYYIKASSICKQVWGTDHYNWGNANYNIGNIYYDLKKYNNSIDHLKISLTIYEKQPTIYSLSLAETYSMIALNYFYLDDVELSLQYGLKAYQSILTYPYADKDEIQEYKDDLERIYTDSGNDPSSFEQWLASQ